MTDRSTAPGSADASPPASRPRGPRWKAWLLGIALGLVGLAVVALIALQQPPAATGVTNAVLGRIQILPRASSHVDQVRGNWLTHLELTDLRLTRGDTLIASLDRLDVRYRLLSLLVGTIHVRELELDAPYATADIIDTTRVPKRPPKPLTLAGLLRGEFYGGPPIRIDRLAVRNGRYGGHAATPDSVPPLTGVELRARRMRLGRGFSFDLDSLVARGRRPEPSGTGVVIDLRATLDRARFDEPRLRFVTDSSAVGGSGALAVDRGDSLSEVRLALQAHPLELGDLAKLWPAAQLEGRVTADIDIHGPRPDQASGSIALAADQLRLGPVGLEATRVEATLERGRADMRIQSIWERARVALTGWVRPFDRAPTYDFALRSDRLPNRIPGVAWWPALAQRAPAAVNLRARGSGFARPVADVQARAQGGAGDVRLDGHLDLARDVSWSVRSLAFERLDVARCLGDSTASAWTGSLSAEAEDSASPSRRLWARLDLAPSTHGQWHIASGRVRASVRGLDMGASLHVATQAGRLEVDSLAGRWDANGTFRLKGARFRELDLAPITRQPALASRLDGNLSGQVRGVASLVGSNGGASAL